MKQTLLLLGLLALASPPNAFCEKIDWSKIEHWTGDGDKKAALVIQFDTDDDTPNPGSLVWGFRWSGPDAVSGEDFIHSIAAASNDLIVLTQFTGNMGSTLDGIGFVKDVDSFLDNLEYDFEGANTDSRISFGFFSPSTYMGQTSAPGSQTPDLILEAIEGARETHVIHHPLDMLTFGYPAYDYDWWKFNGNPADAYWNSGWYNGYWSYWVGGYDLETLSYSGLGMSSVSITDGDVQGWKYINFSKDDSGFGYDDPDNSTWLPLNYSHVFNMSSGTPQIQYPAPDDEPAYFHPDGRRAFHPLVPGLYIKKFGNKTQKIIIK